MRVVGAKWRQHASGALERADKRGGRSDREVQPPPEIGLQAYKSSVIDCKQAAASSSRGPTQRNTSDRPVPPLHSTSRPSLHLPRPLPTPPR